MIVKSLFSCVLLCFASALWAVSPLEPIKTETPQDTMQTYMEAMADYKKGLETNNDPLRARIDDAIRCLNLQDVSLLNRTQVGREAAVFLKEVIDRVIKIDFSKIPNDTGTPENPLLRWRLKDTEITIAKVTEGERMGEYLFSPETVHRAAEFYEKVKHLPYLKGTGGGAGYQEPWLQRRVPDWALQEIFGIGYWQWIGLLVAIFLGLTARVLVVWVIRSMERLVHKTPTEWDNRIIDVLASPVALLVATGIWFTALHLLRFTGTPLTILSTAVQILLFAGLIWLFYQAAELLTIYLKTIADKTASRLDDQLVKLISRSVKVFVVVFGVLLGAQNLGIEVFSLLAGLGIGGLAVALAAKDSLANFFGSIMIMIDRPFRIGHWIVVGDAEGTVEDIGFRSTRIRTFYNSLISIPNSEIATTGVDNMGLRRYRRVKTNLGVTYDTPPEKMEKFIEGVKEIILNHPSTRKDYFHVVFNDFGASSLDILLYFFLEVPDWPSELRERQNILLDIVRLAHKLGVSFAFPTRTLHLETAPGLENKMNEELKNSGN